MDDREVSFPSPERGFLLRCPFSPSPWLIPAPKVPAASWRRRRRGEAERWLSRDAQLQNESAAAGTAWPRSKPIIPTREGLRTRRDSHVSLVPFPELQTPAGRPREGSPGTAQLGDEPWQRFPGRKQLRRKGGVPPAAGTPRLNPAPTGRKGLLVLQGGSRGRFTEGGGGSGARRSRQGHTCPRG